MKTRQKKIVVLMDGSAFANGKAAEAMRMAVGLTLRNPGVHLFLMDGGARVLGAREPYREQQALFMEHLNAFLDLGCPLVLEETQGGRPKNLLEGSGMESRSKKEVIRDITDSDLVILLQGAKPKQEDPERTPEVSPAGEDPLSILHIVRKTPGGLFYQVVRSQGRALRLTVVLFPGADLGVSDLPARILELAARKKQGRGSGLRPKISYSELLDLVLQHQKVFCW